MKSNDLAGVEWGVGVLILLEEKDKDDSTY